MKNKYEYALKIMHKMGWKPGTGLGIDQQGIAHPIELEGNKQKMGIGFHPQSYVTSAPAKEYIIGCVFDK